MPLVSEFVFLSLEQLLGLRPFPEIDFTSLIFVSLYSSSFSSKSTFEHMLVLPSFSPLFLHFMGGKINHSQMMVSALAFEKCMIKLLYFLILDMRLHAEEILLLLKIAIFL